MRKAKGNLGLSKKTLLVLACTGLMALSGCGSSSSHDAAMYDSAGSRSLNATKSASKSYGGGYTNSIASAGAEADDAYYEESYESYDEAAAESAESAEDSSDVINKENSTNKIDTEKLIYRCNISLETQDFAGSISTFQQLIKQYDGFVENENTTVRNNGYGYDNGLGYYTATVRVPSDKYNDFVNSTGDIGNLTNKSQNVTNVSQEYSDLSVELEVLEAQKEDYMEMLKEAKKIEDMDNVILISDKLAQVSTSINQIKTRMNSIDNDVAYSYVDVQISEVREMTEYSEDTFATRFKKEVKQGWYDFGYGCQQFVIWFVANLWGILLFLGIVALIIFIIKKIIKGAIKKSEAKKQARLEQAMMYGNPPAHGQGPSIYNRPNPNPATPAAPVANQAPAAPENKAEKPSADQPKEAQNKKQKQSRFKKKLDEKKEETEEKTDDKE